MRKTISVTVTQDHIHRGRSGSPFCCPIALALTQKLNDHVAVGADGVTVGWETKYQLPRSAINFIKCFDSLDKYDLAKPFRFRMTREEQTD